MAVIFTGIVQAGPLVNLGIAGGGVGNATGGDTLERDAQGIRLNAGEGLLMDLGWDLGKAEDLVSYQLLLGYKYNGILGRNSRQARISAYPVHALAFLNHGSFSFGGGLAYYINPSYVPSAGGHIRYDNALGFVVEGWFKIVGRHKPRVGFRFTDIGFETADLRDSSGNIKKEINANSISVIYGFYL